MPETLDSPTGLDIGDTNISDEDIDDVGVHEVPNLHDVTPVGEGGLDLGDTGALELGRPPAGEPVELTPEQELYVRAIDSLSKDLKDILYDQYIKINSNRNVEDISTENTFTYQPMFTRASKIKNSADERESSLELLLEVLNQIDVVSILENLVSRGWDIDILLRDYIKSRKEDEIKEFFKKLLENKNQTVVPTGSKQSTVSKERHMDIKIQDGVISTASLTSQNVVNQIKGSVHQAKSGFRKLAQMKVKHAFFTNLKKAKGAVDEVSDGSANEDLGALKFLDEPKPSDSDIQQQLETVKDLLNQVLEAVSQGVSFRDQNQKNLSVDELSDIDNAIEEGNNFLEEGNKALESESKMLEKGEEKEEKGKEKEEKGKEKEEKGKEKGKEKEEKGKKEEGKEAPLKEEPTRKLQEKSSREETISRLRERLAALRQNRMEQKKEGQLYGSWKDLCTQKQDTKLNNKEVAPLKGTGDNLPDENSPISLGKRTDISEFKAKFPKPKKASATDEQYAADAVKRAVKASLMKARLATSLACQQQLKGLIPNPLKDALIEEITSTLNVSADVADAIVHNAFLKGYEDSQVNVIKEAFDFLYHQDLNKFGEIVKFVKAYDGSQLVSKNAEPKKEEGDVKVKQASVPLRGTPSDKKDDSRKLYADFWRAYQMENLSK